MPAVPYARFQAEILALYQPPQRRKSTLAKMRKVLAEFGSLTGVRRTSDITPGLIARWIGAHGDRKAISNRSYLNSFRAAVNVARKLEYLRVSPWEIRTDWIDWGEDDEDGEPAARHLGIDQVGRLLDRADLEAAGGGRTEARLQSLVYTYVYTGLRKMEALGLKAEDVRPAEGWLAVRGRRQRRLKTRSSRRRVALHPELASVLAPWLARCGCEWLFPGVRRRGAWLNGPHGAKALDAVQGLASRAGIVPTTIQALRRSIATHSRRFGLGPLELKDLLGHASERTQEWYLEDDLADRKAAVAKIAYRPEARRAAAGP